MYALIVLKDCLKNGNVIVEFHKLKLNPDVIQLKIHYVGSTGFKIQKTII